MQLLRCPIRGSARNPALRSAPGTCRIADHPIFHPGEAQAAGSADNVSVKYASAVNLQAGNALSVSSFRVTAIASCTSVLKGLVTIFPFLLLLNFSFMFSPSSYQLGRLGRQVRAETLKTARGKRSEPCGSYPSHPTPCGRGARPEHSPFPLRPQRFLCPSSSAGRVPLANTLLWSSRDAPS